MDILISELETLSLEELLRMQSHINERIVKLYSLKNRENLIETVKSRGYCCTSESFENLGEIQRKELNYYISLFRYNLENANETVCNGPCKNQERWVSYLGFEYIPKSYEDWEDLNEWEEEWSGGFCGRGRMTIYLYYEIQECPKDSMIIECLNEKNEFQIFKIEDETIITNNHNFVSTLEEWKNLSIFILDSYPNDRVEALNSPCFDISC